VKAICDVPEIQIATGYKGSSVNYSIYVAEWSKEAVSTLTFNNIDYLPKTAVPTFVGDISSYPPATLPEVTVTDATTSTSKIVNVYLVEKDIAAKKAAYAKFTTSVTDYTEKKTAWETAVTALKAYYAKIDAMETAGDKPTLPTKPVVPVLPAAYTGPVLTDFKYSSGFGQLTGFFLKTHYDTQGQIINPFTRKYFGLYGQGLDADKAKGFDANKDIEAIDGNLPKCSNRFFSINLMPEVTNQVLLTSDIVTISVNPNTVRDLVKPTAPTAPVAPSADPTRDSASYLASSVLAAASLAALTLY